MTYYLYIQPNALLQKSMTPAVIKQIERDFQRWATAQPKQQSLQSHSEKP